ncbi:MAG: CPBP family intramembrane glutamic endopeptidase, partial [Verrucomicrobiota bacterium]
SRGALLEGFPMTESVSSPSPRKRLLVVAPAMVLPFIASFFYFVLFPGTSFGTACYSGIKVWLLLWPFVAVLLLLREPLINRSLTKRHRASLFPGFLSGILVVGLLFFLVKGTPLSGVLDENAENIADRIHDLGIAEHYLWFALFISFFHAALEEFYWRWFVFGQLSRVIAIPLAHLIAAAAFASHHVVVLSQFFPLGWAFFLGFCVGVGGFVWSWLMNRYHSLLGAWVSHMIIDLGLMWIGWEALMR